MEIICILDLFSDLPIVAANAHASSGLGGAAATGDGDIMTQVGISAMSSAIIYV